MPLIITDSVAQQAAEHLSKHDLLLRPVIAQAGICVIRPHQDYYRALVRAIVGQQLSVKAAASIYNRFVELFGETFPSPERIIAQSDEALRGVGFSRAKVSYIKDLAQHIVDGTLTFDAFAQLDDDAIIRELISVKGIGVWSAHIFLMFCLARTDVLPVGDLGIRSAAQRLYSFDHLPTTSELEALAKSHQWSPYRSIASWYLWQSLDNEPAS